MHRHLIVATFVAASACGGPRNADVATSADDTTDALSATGNPMLWSANTNKCVDVRGASTANGTPVQLYNCNQTNAQRWLVDGSTARVFGNKCLTVGGSPGDGSKVQSSDCVSGNTLQQWVVSGQQLKMKNYNLCLDLTDGNTANSTVLQVWTCSAGNRNQVWNVQTTAPTTAPVTTTPTASNSCKRGIAYGHHSKADLTALSKSISWWYNWSPAPESTVSSSYANMQLDFVPMLWNGNFSTTALQANIAPSGYLLAFNEPNFYSQANMTPQQAADLWPQVEAIAKAHNMKIVSPAVNYCGGGCNATNPFDWLDQFFAACKNCKVDYIAWHWYACSPEALTSTLNTYIQRYGKPVWLTEFSCMDDGPATADKQKLYLNQALDILEANPNVFRYAWFTGRDDGRPDVNLLGSDGQLTPLGQAYVDHAQNCSR